MSNVTNFNLNRHVRQALYVLKRAFGSTIVLHKLTAASTTYTTGAKTSTSTTTSIPRCIVLPVKLQREVIQTVAQISANKTFAYGGSFESGTREFVIDSHDLATDYSIGLDDWIIYNDRRYDIKNIEELEQHSGWHVTAKMIIGAPVAKTAGASQTLNFTEATDNVI